MFLFGRYFIVLFALCSLYPRGHAATYQSAPPVVSHTNSQEIQNVQNYSSNPFWNPNGPYNQRTIPQAVYVTGPELNSGDCMRAVSAQIASFCQVNNKCSGMRLMDVRPSVMLALSRLPGHNYATACAGYIDSAFNEYLDTANTLPQNGAVAFPSATGGANTSGTNGGIILTNPYQEKVPAWQAEQNAREQELKSLQAQNGANDAHLEKTAFPTTFSDLSFSDRMAVTAAGLEKYKKMKAYKIIELEPSEQAVARAVAKSDAIKKFCAAKGTDGAAAQYAQLKSDLTKLQDCQKKGIQFADCKTAGTY